MSNEELAKKYNDLNRFQINEAFKKAAANENLEEFQYLVVSKDLLYRPDCFEEAFAIACKTGNLTVVDYCLNSEEFKHWLPINRAIENGFFKACTNGHLEVVKHLINSKEGRQYIDIHLDEDEVFRKSCASGHVNVVEYLLTSPDLNTKAHIHADDDYGFRHACANGHLEVVEFLLSSPKIKDHVNIHTDDDCGFLWAAENQENWHVVEYFIFDRKIEKTKTIDRFLKNEKCEVIEKMFEIRDMQKTLTEELPKKEVINKKSKI